MSQAAVSQIPWYAPWQESEHVLRYEFRQALDDRNLVRLYETLNDVRLLKERFRSSQSLTLLEVGCATGDFYRYIQLALAHLSYAGTDVSRPAIDRAREKYPQAEFFVGDPGQPLVRRADILYASDVLHHQTDPFGFLRALIPLASQALILRVRTRDVGMTQWNPDRSRQAHYGRWVPYIVVNLEELIGEIRRLAPGCELQVHRSYKILGGRYGRGLPPECSLRKTGTAETSVGIFGKTDQPGRVVVLNRPDNRPNTTWDHKLRSLWSRMRGLMEGL